MTNVRAVTTAAILIVAVGVAAGASIPVTGDLPLTTTTGFTVTLPSVGTFAGGYFPASGDTIAIASGTVQAPGAGELTIDGADLTGTTALSAIDLQSTTATIDPTDKPAFSIAGDITAVSMTGTPTPDDGTDDITITQTSTGEVTFTGLSANQGYLLGTLSGSSFISVDAETSDGSGAVTFDDLQQGTSSYRIVSNQAPIIDDASVQPAPGSQQTGTPTFSVDVSDPNNAQVVDEVTVTLFVNGVQKGQTTLVQNGTAQFSPSSGFNTGANTYHFTAEDDLGATDRSPASGSYTFTAPDELRIFNESSPQQLVTNANVEVRFFGSETVVTRSTTTGSVSFSGLPADEEFVARIDAPGFHDRTVQIPSLFDQQDVYILDTNVSTVTSRFLLDDATGTYTEQSALYIEKPLEVSPNQTKYRIIVSDSFGVDGVTVRLEEGVRYQLRLENDRGDTAALGNYQAQVDEAITLQPAAPSVTTEDLTGLYHAADYDPDTQTVSVEYVDPESLTQSLTIGIATADGTVLAPNQTYTTNGSLVLSLPLNASLDGRAFVTMTGTRDGDALDITIPIGPDQMPLVPGALDSVWVQVMGAVALLMVGGLFSTLNVAVGAIVTSLFAGILWFFGILTGLASGAAVALAIGLSVLNLLAGERR